MTMTLASRLVFGVSGFGARQYSTASPVSGVPIASLTTVTDPLNLFKTLAWLNGTGADQANLSYHITEPVVGGASRGWNLASGLTNAMGEAVAFAAVKALYLENLSTLYSLTIGGTNGIVGSGFTLKPGECFLKALGTTGYPVVAATSDVITIAAVESNEAHYATYKMAVLGVTS